MKNEGNNIQKIDQIMEHFNSFINELINEFDYLKLSNEQFHKIISEKLELLMNNNDNLDVEKDKKIFKQNISVAIYQYIHDELGNNNYSIINDWINKNINVQEKEMSVFDQITKFLNSVKYEPSSDCVRYLLTNNKIVDNIIDKIVSDYEKDMENDQIENLFDDLNLILFVQTYCTMNNIKTKENEEVTLNNVNVPSSDSVRSYLNEMSRYPLLSPEEEKEVFTLVAQGDEAARKKAVESNLRLVVSIAKRYLGQGLDFLDLIQEGNLGLMKAVQEYDVNKGFRFSTYATWWIRQHVTRGIHNTSRMIRLPVHMYEQIGQYKKIKKEYYDEHQSDPTDVEMSLLMNTSISKIREYKLHDLIPTSLSTPIGEEEDSTLEDFIPSTDPLIEDKYTHNVSSDEIMAILDKVNLSDREKFVLLGRNGFYSGGEKCTLEQIGAKLGVTRERVRQIEAKALTKIRRNPIILNYIIYMDNPAKAEDAIKQFRRQNYIRNRMGKKI